MCCLFDPAADNDDDSAAFQISSCCCSYTIPVPQSSSTAAAVVPTSNVTPMRRMKNKLAHPHIEDFWKLLKLRLELYIEIANIAGLTGIWTLQHSRRVTVLGNHETCLGHGCKA